MNAKQNGSFYQESYRKWQQRRVGQASAAPKEIRGMAAYEEEKHRRKDFSGRVLLARNHTIRKPGHGAKLSKQCISLRSQ